MEENKKSGGGDVRAKALSWDIEREKAKNVFFGFLPLAPTVGCFAPHSHPSPPEKKAASRRKSRLRRKKTAPAAFLNHEYVTLRKRWGLCKRLHFFLSYSFVKYCGDEKNWLTLWYLLRFPEISKLKLTI